ncbi:hypothetical protein [Variovorax sp. HJSM1_2]|uniref:hypothetical protein n=1 Tax=Variovorax sp. HJSM1_2 TaxID=3366263 RepID=UPI003BD163D6
MDSFSAAGHRPATSQLRTPPTLRDWERLMHHGRHAQLLGQQTSALQLTLEALTLAATLLEERLGPPDDCVAAWVVSQHNMAFLRQQAGDTDSAASDLCQAHAGLMALLRDASASPALQQAAWRHSRETHAALLQFLREPGVPAHASALTQVRQALSAHANLAQHCGATAH